MGNPVTKAIFITFADGEGRETTRTWLVPEITNAAQVLLAAEHLTDLVSRLIKGKVVKAGILVYIYLFSPSMSLASADIQEQLLVGARSANGFLKRFNLPTVNEGKVFVPGTKEADRTDTDVDAYLTALINGIDLSGVGGTGTVQFSDNRGSDLIAIETAQETFKD